MPTLLLFLVCLGLGGMSAASAPGQDQVWSGGNGPPSRIDGPNTVELLPPAATDGPVFLD